MNFSKPLAVAALSLAMLAPANAAPKQIKIPREFDHIYNGKITVIRDSAWSLPCRPRSLSAHLGCTYPQEDECVVYLATRDDIKEAGYTEDAVWRHEMAYCNGWKDYRPLRGKDEN